MAGLSCTNLLSMRDLDRQDINLILDTAETFAEVNARTIKKLPTLRGRTIVNMFMENSTRTRSSFELAQKRLSADSLNFSAASSSTQKGESLQDTAQTLSAMHCDLVVIRHRYAGSPYLISQNMQAKVINAGDGKHEHPTQALLDLMAIRRHFGHFDGLKCAIVGDIAHSRVVGSLGYALHYLGAEVIFVAPQTLLPARPDLLGADRVTSDLDSLLPELDVCYMLRIQQERIESSPFPSLREYAMLYGIDRRRLALLDQAAVIMHPGPVNRGVELSSEAVDNARNLLLEQVADGVCVRMALMYLMLGEVGD
ncbi:MAG: aspartate carbamoyltransferase catalytic subunit [Coriobacteriales bacterium]|jgi:aspartate carbamoyltransferase catalytic subunit|nr:aspartate carbamoyltransferase catalytic subunit [Coriobacteriales bacterium]